MSNNRESFTTTHGKNPKQIHIAHRRSPSELTNLMIEQIALQRQLEIVQHQQQQIISQQSNNNNNNNPSSYHKRNNSNNHRRAQSSVTGAMGSFALPQAPGAGNSSSSGAAGGNSLAPPPKINSNLGHNRRHSLGLNEAKKAAAEVQAQRAGRSSNNLDSDDSTPSPSLPSSSSTTTTTPPSGFKFPSTVVDPPQSQSPYQTVSRTPSSHNRSRSIQSPQRSYQFPPKSPQHGAFLNPNDLPLQQPQQAPQQPSFTNSHDRRPSGHYRSNSRNNNFENNWRRQQSPSRVDDLLLHPPNPNFTPGHRSRGSYGGNSSISSISGFQQGGQHGGQVGGRKSLFAPYLPQSSIPELVAEGRLVVGTLRVNKKNRSDAYVSTDGLLDSDIFICGSKDRNRALEGDLVAVELLSVDEVWSGKREKEEKKRRKDNNDTNDDVHNDASTHSTSLTSSAGSTNDDKEDNSTVGASSSLKRKGSLKQRPTLKKNDDVEVEGQSLLLVEEEEINDEYKPLYAGHVVAVIDRIPGQLFVGTLGLLRPSQQQQQQKDGSNNPHRPKIVWFKPTDKKVPLIAIPTEQAPKDFVENVDNYTNKVFVAGIKRWPITSLHPFGTLVGELGPMNDADIEVDAILRDNNFLCDEYDGDFEINEVDFEEEFSKRRDFTNEYVVAISETGALSDSSLHVKRISKDKIELGVHISDVTAFIKEGSSLDKNARKRSSSVFLAQKTVDLLPKNLNEILSFEKGKKSLSLSVCFEIDTTKFEVDNVYIGESFIQPKIKITYDKIDSILKGDYDNSNASIDYIKTISLISREFRRQRLENSNLDNETNLTLLDQIDDEKVRLSLNLFETNLSFNVLNEIYLKVNTTIGQRNYAILGDQAFLRRQNIPTLNKLESFKKKIENFGIEIDTSSSSSLINSILSIKDETARRCVEILFYKSLSRSKYYIAGKVEPENYGAYYFNLPIYTHFTSPLRRYADFIVHRQLKQVLNEVKTTADLESLKMTSEYCNFKKDCAKSAQYQSVHLLLSKTINDMSAKTGQLIVIGTVLQVYESSFDVFIPEFGIEKRVHGDQLPLKKCEFDKNDGVLELYWENGVDSATYIPEDERDALSYRNSIKNKYKVGANEIVKLFKDGKVQEEKQDSISQDLSDELTKLSLTPPDLKQLGKSKLDEYFKGLKLRVDKEQRDYVQEIRELEKIPILLRSEIGMALPCLTVHALNPFINE